MSRTLEEAKATARSLRSIEVEHRMDKAPIRGDFEGSVRGTWVRLDDGGAGVVLYKGKEYKVRTIGFSSLTAGAPVLLTYADGIYVASF